MLYPHRAIAAACTLSIFTLGFAQSTTTRPSTTNAAQAQGTVPASANVGLQMIATFEDPDARDAQALCPGYIAKNVTRTRNGLTATLLLAKSPCNAYGTDVESLNLTVEYQSKDRLNVHIIPTNINASNRSHYILPESLLPRPGLNNDWNEATESSDLLFEWGNDPSFFFTVVRKSSGDALFSTKGSQIVFENQFIEFKSPLPKDYNLYGLGEVIHGLRLGNNLTRTIWASQVGDPIDGDTYGTHPFYLDTRYYETHADGSMSYVPVGSNFSGEVNASYSSVSHGVFLRNIHGQEVLLRPEGITWRTLGGSIDLYFYAGPTQKKVTKAYQASAVGFPALQQYWTFGLHQCRWGYKNWSMVEDVVANYENAGIAMETIWTDIDYMNQYRDFTVDSNNFPMAIGKKFLEKLHASGRHYVPIIDSAIYVPNAANSSDGYDVFTRGNESDVFLRNPDGSLYIGSVWPGYTVFPDWLSVNASQWWSDELNRFYKELKFDGIWIDMSEASSFCVGSCGTGKLTDNPAHPSWSLPGEPGNVDFNYPEGFSNTNASEAASASSAAAKQSASNALTAPSSTSIVYFQPTVTPGARDINWPPYIINYDQKGHDLAVDAVSNNATHQDGTVEYDVHSLFGHQIVNATYNALLETFPSKRPFIIGRSTIFGTGKWAGHWGGDNYSKWLYMYFAIPQALSFSLFGIPMFGTDSCGFIGNTDEELCSRWMQMSAFFTFYRNHNSLSEISQEAYIWPSVAQATRDVLRIRGLLLPYIYTLMYDAHATGSTVMTALAWEFPNDPILADADRQFLLGPSVMVTPVLEQGAVEVQAIFPGIIDGTIWYDWYNQTAMEVTAGVNTTIQAPLGHIPVFIKGGSILPMQEPAMTIKEGRQNPWAVLAAFDDSGSAQGSLYIDDGESVSPNATLFVDFTAYQHSLSAVSRGLYRDSNSLENVTILGLTSPVTELRFNGVVIDNGWTYDNTSKVLHVTGLQDHSPNGAFSNDWELMWN